MEENEEKEIIEQKTENTNQVNQEELIRIWIGEKADEMYPKMQRSGSFNVCAFLFGVFYLAYRKMYLVALIAFLISAILSQVGSAASLLLWIATGFCFYPIYKWDITRKLKDCEYMHKSPEETIEYAREKGGTSVGAVFVCLIPYFILIAILLLSASVLVMNSMSSMY